MDFGATLKAKRTSLRLGIVELSRRAGVSVGTISEIERGVVDPRLSTVLALCQSLGINLIRLQ